MSHFERLVALVLLLGAGVGGYFLYQSPQIRELFSSSSPNRPMARPAQPARRQPTPGTERSRSRVAAAKPPERQPASSPAPSPKKEPNQMPNQMSNQVPNRQVASVLLQILAARSLASGVSLSVSDEQIEVIGETASAENRATILEVIEKGRENRKIVAELLVVRSP